LTEHVAPAVQVVGGILRRNGKLFLCHRRPERTSYPDLWDLPGGHVNEDETIGDALVRELDEELGIQVEPPQGDPWVTLESNDLQLHLFLIDTWEGEPRNLAVDEHDDIRWVSDGELAHLKLADPTYLSLLRQALVWEESDQGSPSE
jgi:mutator protein MutT